VNSGFEAAYGEPLYDYLGRNSTTARRFQETMNAGGMFFDEVPELLDFSGHTRVVDVGGGGGHLLATILTAFPNLDGTLFDREHMLPKAREHLAATVGLDRVRLVGGDMRLDVPAGGDVYILCRVLAAWDDDVVVTIFENCRRAMAGSSPRLLVLDRFVDDDEPTILPALWDLHLLMTTGGGHRSLSRVTNLVQRTGFDVVEIKELPMETTALIGTPSEPSST